MTVEMKKYRLADIAEIVISSVDKKTKPGEKIVRLCNFTDVYHNWAIKQSDYDSFMVASASDSNINKLSLKKGFVAFTKDSETRDDIGISTYIADDFDDVVLGYHCALAKPNEKIVYGKYLNAFMSSDYIKKYFELNATGSGMRFTLAVSTMEDMPIMLPSLNVQKKIGDMLSDFDKRIENLRAQNRVLEQTAKTIYDYTFLQCAGHQTTYNKILNRNIPADWEIDNLYRIADFTNGLACQKYRPMTERDKLPVIKIREMHDGVTADTEFVRSDIPEKVIVNPGDLLFSWSASLEVMMWNGVKGGLNQHIFKVTPKEYFSLYFVYFQLKDYIGNFKRMAEARKTTMGHITTVHLNQSRIAIPDEETMKRFSSQVTPLFKKQLVNSQQIETLTTQRNTLLPLLMTGQIEV